MEAEKVSEWVIKFNGRFGTKGVSRTNMVYENKTGKITRDVSSKIKDYDYSRFMQ